MATKNANISVHSRSNSTVIPAIPRLFEKKTTNVGKEPQIGANILTGQAPKQSGTSNNATLQDIGKNRNSQYLPPSLGTGGSLTKPAHNQSDLTPKQGTVVITSDSPSPRRFRVLPTGAPEYQRSVSFPPLSAEKQQQLDLQAGEEQDVDTIPTSRSHRKRSVHNIAFGSFGNQSESSGSSPTIPLSATSTQCTQPTPASETRSQASKSENEKLNIDNQQEIWQRRPVGTDHGFGSHLIGPYPPGFIGNHALNFVKHQQQYLAQHIQDLFRRSDGDVAFDVVFKSGTIRYNLHSAIVSQSPLFAKAIEQGFENRHFSSEGKLYVPINVQDKFITATAIETILKSMYGIASFDIKALSQPYLDLQFFLALFAASCLLAMPVYQIFSSNCIIELLSWQTLPRIFDLCLTGKQFSATRDPFPRRTEEIVTPIFQPQVALVFDRAVSVLAQELSSQEFSFDSQAPTLHSIGGLPHNEPGAESKLACDPHRKTTSDDMNSITSSKSRFISCIVLSLPLLALQRVLAEIKTSRSADIVELILLERQQRREKWSKIPGQEELGLLKEACIPVDILPNGVGLIHEIL